MLSPNPATNTTTISAANINSTQQVQAMVDEVRIYDMQGNLKKYYKLNKVKSAKVDISELKSGNYFIEITDGSYKEKLQLLIQK